jgi:RimJ/RimL family protein N-acetyltransferase
VTHPVWPLFDLRLRTPRLELRLPADEELAELCAIARAGIHEADEMPFAVPWTDLPSPAFERGFAQYHWRMRAEWRPERWALELMTLHEGRPVGMQGLSAMDFAILRTVSTGSWLGRPWQARGFGKEMRAAVLALAFDGLSAHVALSEALEGNESSMGVSRALGYEANGVGRCAPRGVPVETRLFRLSRARWDTRHATDACVPVEISGLEGCLDLFGATPGATDSGG